VGASSGPCWERRRPKGGCSTSAAADRRREARRWLQFAREDLLGAATLISDVDAAPRLACFFAQQAAEKALKARLIAAGVPFPRVHDLLALRALLPAGSVVGLDDDAQASLAVWATEARYPGDLPEASRADAERSIEQAREVGAAAEEDVRTPR
jgi:HEPN domain-containing protein